MNESSTMRGTLVIYQQQLKIVVTTGSVADEFEDDSA